MRASSGWRSVSWTETAKMEALIQVGTILHYSWGYEQTNCEYWQVVERTGRTVKIREIASEQTRATSPMASMVKPRPGAFLEGERHPTLRKVIGPYGISFDFGTGTPCAPDSENYSSWYA